MYGAWKHNPVEGVPLNNGWRIYPMTVQNTCLPPPPLLPEELKQTLEENNRLLERLQKMPEAVTLEKEIWFYHRGNYRVTERAPKVPEERHDRGQNPQEPMPG